MGKENMLNLTIIETTVLRPSLPWYLQIVSRYEHSLIADLLLHVRGAHGDLLKNFTPQLSVKEYD